MIRSVCVALGTAALLGLSGPAWSAPPKPTPVVQPAVDGVLKAFETHSVVALGEIHGVLQEQAFYIALINDPRFAQQVGNVVLETASASDQDILDRYEAGEDVPYTELQKVWLDTVGWFPGALFTHQHNLFAAIRAVNLRLPADRRIHVWAGEPPADWSKIKTAADFEALHLDRDQYPADLVRREILAKGKKVLVIYGGSHFTPPYDMNRKIEAGSSQRVFVIQLYSGSSYRRCDQAFEKSAGSWPMPSSLVTPVKETWVADLLNKPACNATTMPPLTALADGLLYLGPAANQIDDSMDPIWYLDRDLFNELNRRIQIRSGTPWTWDAAVGFNDPARVTETQRRRMANQPAAVSEAALRKYLLAAQSGQMDKVDFGSLTSAVTLTVKTQWPTIAARAKAWGNLKTLTFEQVGGRGIDLYEADFEHARSMWQVQIGPDGKMTMDHQDLP
jgi:hypothetical protein